LDSEKLLFEHVQDADCEDSDTNRLVVDINEEVAGETDNIEHHREASNPDERGQWPCIVVGVQK